MAELNLAYNNEYLAKNPVSDTSEYASQSHVQASILDIPNPLLPEVVHPRLNISQPAISQVYDRIENLLLPEPVSDISQIETQLDNRQQSTSETIQSFPISRPNIFQNPNADRRPSNTVRFADDAELTYFSENWSCIPNSKHTFNTSRNMLLDELENRLAALNFGADTDDLPSYLRNKFPDICRWNLRYDGIASVNDFLDRIEELRRSRGVSKTQLLRSAAELFSKDALLWFRTNQFSSWDDLVRKLRDSFQPYDYGIWEELRRRTQGAQERVIIFIASMEQLFNRLSIKPTEETLV